MKHISFCNHLDNPATERQIAYLNDLIIEMRTEFSEPDASDLVASLVIPAELTNFEASALITIFNAGRRSLPGFVMSEEKRRASGGKIKSTGCAGAALRVTMPETYNIIVKLLKEKGNE